MIRCAICGHSWIESRAVSVIDVVAIQESGPSNPESTEQDLFAEREVMRLAQAARAAEAKFAAARAHKRKERKAWALLAALIAFPALIGLMLPQEVAQAFPPARMIYSLAGLEINVSGLEFRQVGQQHSLVDGVRVLTIQGEIVNVGKRERKIPPLAFFLKDDRLKPVYDWRLTATTQPIGRGEVSTFLTRIASPPDAARHIEIRFAPQEETGSNAGP
jgi:hypothetical protein